MARGPSLDVHQEPRFARLLGWLLVMVPAAALFALVAWILSWQMGAISGVVATVALALWAALIGRHRASWLRR